MKKLGHKKWLSRSQRTNAEKYWWGPSSWGDMTYMGGCLFLQTEHQENNILTSFSIQLKEKQANSPKKELIVRRGKIDECSTALWLEDIKIILWMWKACKHSKDNPQKWTCSRMQISSLWQNHSSRQTCIGRILLFYSASTSSSDGKWNCNLCF